MLMCRQGILGGIYGMAQAVSLRSSWGGLNERMIPLLFELMITYMLYLLLQAKYGTLYLRKTLEQNSCIERKITSMRFRVSKI